LFWVKRIVVGCSFLFSWSLRVSRSSSFLESFCSFSLMAFVVTSMSQPYFGQVWGWSPTLGKSEDLESSGTLECSEFDNKAQNTSH
jgi:hypothetical protein